MQHKATRTWSLPAIILAFVLAAALVAQVLTQAAVSNQALAAETTPIADANTTNGYRDSLGDGSSTRYAGRVWTDKTVYTEDATFQNDDGSQNYTIPKGDSDFLVAYSALATSQAISGETKVPIDVVFVIDLSGSMDTSMGQGRGTRAENTVEAVNTAIRTLMNLNEYTRVAVVAYSDTAQVLLPLRHYGSVGAREEYLTYHEGTGGIFGNPPSVSTSRATGVSQSKYVTGGTNTQAGTYMGMNLLASTDSTTATINGQQVNRVPSVILLSDGQATFSSDSKSWWAPENNDNDGDGSSSYAGNGMKLMMTAAYMKDEIDRHYNVTDPAYGTTFYTVGMGITGLTGSAKNLADISLNPGAYWNDDNEIATEIRDAWNQYAAGGNPQVQVGDNGFIMPNPEYYTFNHPNTGYDVTSINDYVDQYYDADDADTIAGVFEDIVGNIAISRPTVPTETNPEQPNTSGYITYTDPIGSYMEVEDVKAILWSGTLFDQKETQPISNGTRYVFQGDPINSPVYGEHELSEIIIEVTAAADGQQTLTVKIPATCIPLRVNSVTLDSNGNVESNVSNGAYPFRLLYTVDLKNDVIDADGRVNTDVVSKDYIAANTENGMVNFYSNLYSKQTQGQDDAAKTVGDATVTFTPASDNPFYFVQENTPLYLDEGRTPATSYDRDATYYFQISYYEGTELKTAWVSRSADLMEDYTDVIDEQLNLKAGSPRLGYLTQFIKDKGHNTTNTAATSYYPTFEGTPEAGEFVVYLGNNGKLQVNAPVTPPGDLTISKTVAGNQGETDTDKDFMFDVTLTNATETLSGSYPYTKTNADATLTNGTVSVGADGKAAFTPNGGTAGALTLKGGESVTISDLPAGTSFTVTEQDPNTNGAAYETSIVVNNGDVQTPANRTASGTIVSNAIQTVAYTNTWNVLMHSFDFTKIDGTGMDQNNPQDATPLSGAQFKLFEPVCQDPSHNHENELIETPFEPDPCWKLVTDENHLDGVFTSGEDGKVSFDDLLANGVTYRLIEVQAPGGFQRPQGQWNLTITQEVGGDGTTEVRVNTTAVGAMNSQPAFIVNSGDYYLPNYKPMDPPITGGRGMTGFMLGGGLLIALGLSAAAFWLIRSSKQKRSGYRYR